MMSKLMFAALSCFAIGVAVAEDSVTTGKPAPSVNLPERGLLIGANTPVWIASRPDPAGPVNYTRYYDGIIESAVETYRFLKENSRAKREIEDYDYVDNDLDNDISEKEASESKRSTPEVVEYSFLVVMDYYKRPWPTPLGRQLEEVKKKIIHVIAFYNALNIQLRHIQNPRIRLRIVGIVISSEKDAVPYLRSAETSTGMDIEKAAREASGYWKNMSRTNEFHYTNWHYLAVMTDSEPQPVPHQNSWEVSYWSLGHIPYAGGGDKRLFLFNDDAAFRALPVGGWRNMKPIGDMMVEYGRWMDVSIDTASFGPLVESDFLPGDVVPIYMQCEKRGFDEFAKPCKPHVYDRPCQQLRCANDHWYSQCWKTGPHLVGTVCSDDKKKICLDGECSDRPAKYLT